MINVGASEVASNPPAVARVVECLSGKLGAGKVLTTGSQYEWARRGWNYAADFRPAAIVFCENKSDVQVCVEAARSNDVSVSVRSGGSSPRALRGDVVIDLRRMNRVEVDVHSATATADGGATSMAVAKAASEHGFLAVTGIKGGVGIVGLTTGGGYGNYTSKFGLALDNLLAAEVVLADGRVIETDADHEPDLFWAIRGGGGNFGVITKLTLQLHRVPDVSYGAVAFPWDQAKNVLAAYDSVVPTVPDELTLTPTYFAGPNQELSLVIQHAWCGDRRDDDRAVKLVTKLGTPTSSLSRRMTCADVLRSADRREQGEGVRRRVRTLDFPHLDHDVIAITAEAMERRSSPLSWIGGHPFYGVGERIPLTSTAFGVRTRHFMLGIYCAWTSTDPGPHVTWADDVEAKLKPYAMAASYPNYLLEDDRPQQADDTYGPNAGRLLELKARYDPTGMFAAIPLPRSA